jgi:hypothetical protein
MLKHCAYSVWERDNGTGPTRLRQVQEDLKVIRAADTFAQPAIEAYNPRAGPKLGPAQA